MSTPSAFGVGRYISGVPIIIQPEQFTANVNTLFPRWIQEGLQQPTYILRMTSDASRELRGLDILTPGSIVWCFNAGTQNIVVVNESTAAEERYRFVNATGADVTITAGQIFPVIRDVANRWRLEQSAGGTTPSIVTTKGDLLGYSTVPDRVPVGADWTLLTSESAQALGLQWKNTIRLADGSEAQPSHSFLNGPAGLWYLSGPDYVLFSGRARVGANLPGGNMAIWSGASTGSGGSGEVLIEITPSGAAGSTANGRANVVQINEFAFILGGADTLVTTFGTLCVVAAYDRKAGSTDGQGDSLLLRGGQGTGNATGGGVFIQVSPPGPASGSVQNGLQDAIRIDTSLGISSYGGVSYQSPGTNVLASSNRAAGVTDGAGANLAIAGGRGTGTGQGGSVILQTAPGATGTGSTQNALVDHERWSVTTDADPQARTVALSANNGAQWIRGSLSELLTLNTGAVFTDTTNNLLPANAIIEAVVVRVNTTITTAVSFSVGDPTTAARFSASAGGLTAASQRIGLQHHQGSVATDAAGPVQTAAAKVRITLNANPGAGVVRIVVFYRSFVAPSS